MRAVLWAAVLAPWDDPEIHELNIKCKKEGFAT